MIDEYKKFLKQNTEQLFIGATVGGGVLLFFFIMMGGTFALTSVGRFVSNSREIDVYRENLATFQKCAEKVTDASLIESYCGETPRKPTLIW